MPLDLSIADAVKQLLQRNAPVLLLDTCAVLDIIRAPTRQNTREVQTGAELLRLASQTPASIAVVGTPVIHDEWNEHSPKVVRDLEIMISRLHNDLQNISSACTHSGISIPKHWSSQDTDKLPDTLLSISRGLIHNSILLGGDDACAVKALHRNIKNIPPSRKGERACDCVIIEHYIALCRGLTAGGFGKKVVFVSSNKNDYCEPSTSNMHANLLAEFAGLRFQYVTNLSWALSEITSP